MAKRSSSSARPTEVSTLEPSHESLTMRLRNLLIAVGLVALFLAFHVWVERRGKQTYYYHVIETVGDDGRPRLILIPRDLPDAEEATIRAIADLKREGKPYKVSE